MKTKLITILVVFVLITPIMALAAEKTESKTPAPTATPPRTWSVTRPYWKTYMLKALPPELCKDKSYFRECFTITAEICNTEATKATSTCIKEQEKGYPDPFNQPDDGRKYGRKLGECTGLKFEMALAGKRNTANKDCNDPTKWLGQ